ncbi:folate biopterin transporter, partial [Nannochloropsis oceanica]
LQVSNKNQLSGRTSVEWLFCMRGISFPPPNQTLLF